MQGKTRVMAAVAAGALIVALGAGAARCAIAPQEDAQGSFQEQTPPGAADADAGTVEGASGAEALWNTVWTGADDPTATLRIVEGAMVESDGGTERAWFFSAEEPSEAGGVLSVPIDVKGTGDKAGGLSLIQVSGSGDARTLACDLLTQAYVPQRERGDAFSVTGIDGRLSEALGADAAAIEDAVAKKAAEVSSQATGATWDKEVWLDYAGNVASTTFTLDDPASTVVTVVSRGGSLEAM